MENGDAAFHSKSGFARIPRIEVENAADAFAKRFVRVAEDDHIRLLASDPTMEVFVERSWIDDMVDQELALSGLDDFCWAETKARFVRVPNHGSDGCDIFQLQNERGHADVSSVQDVFDSLEKGEDFWVEEIVGVGDD